MAETTPLPSRPLLDRLLDDNPDRAEEPATALDDEVGALRAALRRDLEALLNTRRRFLLWPEELGELRFSLVNYGLKDLTNDGAVSFDMQGEVVAVIAGAIRTWEPRLERVEVTVARSDDERILRFRIQGTVQAGRHIEMLAFESRVDVARREHAVVDSR